MIKEIFLICIALFLIRCNNHSKPNTHETLTTNLKTKSSILENNISNKDTIRLKTSLNKLQGIWIGEKDLNQSIPYRIQYNKRILEIICVEEICDEGNYDNSIIEIGYLGFSNDKNKQLFNHDDLENDGNLMIKLNSEISIDENYKINDVFYTTNLIASYIYEQELCNTSSFSKINSLPIEIFSKLKNQEIEKNRNYIKEFNIYEFSSKIKTVKTHFHNEMSHDSKRKAFLVKGDIAYLESLNDKWAKGVL